MEHTLSPAPPAVHSPKPGRVPLAAGILAAAGSLLWFVSRSSPDVSFGVWQGPLLDQTGLYTVPILSSWLAAALQHIEIGTWTGRLGFTTALFAAGTCGLLAALIASLAQMTATWIEAFAAGLLAAGVLATTPAMTYATTGASPGALSAALAILAVLLMILSLQSEHRLGYLMSAALLAGLATTNTPAFGLLLLFVLLLQLLFPTGLTPYPGMLILALVFALGASIPAQLALSRQESFAEFLRHALSTPYPTLGDGRLRLDLARDLAADLSIPALLLTVPAVVLFFRGRIRGPLILMGALLLAFGPFLPFLTNQKTQVDVLRELDSSRLVALAMVSGLAALGTLVAVRMVSDTPRARPLRLAVLLATGCLLVVLNEVRAPDRRHTLGREVGRQVLESCPPDALLISGDPALTSLVTACQKSLALRPDVTVLPVQFMLQPELRDRLRRHLGAKVVLEPDFPSEHTMRRWKEEQPQILQALVADTSVSLESPRLLDLALWDFVRDNAARWPVCFLAVDSSWLLARAQLSGTVFAYPRRQEPAPTEIYDLTRRVLDSDIHRRDPGIGEALARVLIPISGLLRSQGSAAEAQTVAELVERVNPGEPLTTYAMARATARQGKNEQAAKYAETYSLRVAISPNQQEDLVATLQSDMLSKALTEQFEDMVGREVQGEGNGTDRQKVAEQLWEEDVVFPLARGFQRLTEHNPSDIDALYQGAIAMVQLGELPEAERLLRKAAGINEMLIAERMMADRGKFALLQAYVSQKQAQRSKSPAG